MASSYHIGQIRPYGPSSPHGILHEVLITQLQPTADPDPDPECWPVLHQDG